MAKKIARHKDVSGRLLRGLGINAPENAVFEQGETERAWRWAEPLHTLVLKPTNGRQGQDVFMGVQTRREFLEAFESIGAEHGQVLVEEFRSGIEHRCQVVDNRLVGVTRRRPANVVGDGTSTIEQLVREKNLLRGTDDDRGRIHKQIRLGTTEQRTLRRQGLGIDSVPDYGSRINLRANSNINTGGDAVDATGELTSDERQTIETAARAFPGLRFAGFDVLLPRNNGDSDLSIIEINSNSMISIHHFPWEGEKRDVAGAVIDAMFPATVVG